MAVAALVTGCFVCRAMRWLLCWSAFSGFLLDGSQALSGGPRELRAATTRRELLVVPLALGATLPQLPAFAEEPESDLARAMREASEKKTVEPRSHGTPAPKR